MKIAIIGAGISGLACALELERHRIKPIIFEQKTQLGEDLDFGIANLRLFNHFRSSITQFLKTEYGIDLSTTNPINKITMMSSNKKMEASGNLGFGLWRGTNKMSIESQLANKINSPIYFDNCADITKLQKNFDFIIVANGDDKIVTRFNVWNPTYSSFVRVATVSGNFDPFSWKIWFNTYFAHNSFAYLAPLDSKKASISLIVNNIDINEIDLFWQRFLKSPMC